MMRKVRNGKYAEYGKKVLTLLYYHQHITKPFDIITKNEIALLTRIPKSSCHDVLKNLENKGLITVSDFPEKSVFLDFLEESRLLTLRKYAFEYESRHGKPVDSYFDEIEPIHPTKFVKITIRGIKYVEDEFDELN